MKRTKSNKYKRKPDSKLKTCRFTALLSNNYAIGKPTLFIGIDIHVRVCINVFAISSVFSGFVQSYSGPGGETIPSTSVHFVSRGIHVFTYTFVYSVRRYPKVISAILTHV